MLVITVSVTDDMAQEIDRVHALDRLTVPEVKRAAVLRKIMRAGLEALKRTDQAETPIATALQQKTAAE